MADALERGVDWLLAQQSPEGWWSGELETNVTMTAEQILLFRFLGVDVQAIRDGAIAHMLGCQREDGSWALYYDGPADVSTTIEAYVALKVLGVDPECDPMQRALRVILRRAVSPKRAYSPRSGSRFSACIHGTASPHCRRRWFTFRSGCRSISTISPAGRAERWRR